MTTTQEAGQGANTQLPGGPASVPTLPTAVKDANSTRELMFILRHFHLGDPGAKGRLETLGNDFLPALLDPFRDTSRLRYDYPLLLYPPEGMDGHQKAAELACPLADFLQQTTLAFAPERDAARILKDHLPWLEHRLRQDLAEAEGPVQLPRHLVAAGEALQERLQLDSGNRARLAGDLERLTQQIPDGATVLSYGRYASMHLLVHAIRSRVVPRRARFRTLINNCIRGLKELFEVEWGKSVESIEPAQARDSVGPGATLFDAAALSEVMDHSHGTRQMSAERRQRIQRVLALLEGWQDDPVLVRFVHDSSLNCEWLQDDDALVDEENGDPCTRATALFDQQAQRLAGLFAAVRIAQLEINGIYDPIIHDPWFASFDWEGFTHDELLLVPTVIAVESADRVAREGRPAFSRLLSSGRPVQILIRVRPSGNPGAAPDEDPFHNYRTELGYLGIAHRQAVVAQTSAARHQHMLDCYLGALDATRTSLHLINTGLRPAGRLLPLNAWLVAGAALEGRAHPFFRVNPQAGDYAAVRMYFGDNPQEDKDWPEHPFHYQDENGNQVELELAFTFADYALLIEDMHEHFRIIPPGCDSEALVPMQDYLTMQPDEAYQRVPFVWTVDGNALLHRLVVSRELAMACLDRLNFWHTLQELAGVRNRYVERAIEQTRQQEQELARSAREQLQAEHRAEVERVSSEAAGEAMQRLTDILLGLDFSAAPGGLQPSATTAGPAATESTAPETNDQAAGQPATTDEEEEGEEELSFDEPWIDTPLCTSCNDCLKVNPLLFIYNDEKQALLGDLSKASYAQLVEAAELCPARCIHPGKPWNPDESNLPDLIERAAPFNQ
jgi:ferredoxin